MRLVSEYTVRARPDRGVIEVYDADAFLGDDEALKLSRSRVVAGNGYHLYLRSLQPDIPVRVTVRLWDGPRPSPAACEGSTPVTLESATGELVVNRFTLGPAGGMRLPRPGVYEGHASWTGRRATADHYNRCLAQGAAEHWSPDRIGRAWADCPVVESYVLDLWYVREPEPPEGEED
ncbi:hypothetical protein GCM10023347_40850 [Streptomyces chumphonensis]|uniref:Uncharacterized protein n=1 Tax=Streptomyces chumphonensis TaxID=1214925 RepID=A0A927EV55_9ACTN|nr:hypothetical protein [Streptomyces chumphonensis]MBD3930399.1 hypothetical protein [Streptomyces chumphonensis]